MPDKKKDTSKQDYDDYRRRVDVEIPAQEREIKRQEERNDEGK